VSEPKLASAERATDCTGTPLSRTSPWQDLVESQTVMRSPRLIVGPLSGRNGIVTATPSAGVASTERGSSCPDRTEDCTVRPTTASVTGRYSWSLLPSCTRTALTSEPVNTVPAARSLVIAQRACR
jgi:hypothetical protein